MRGILLYTHTRIVLETLKGVDPDRKCFRMVGGVLVERTVKEVVPALEHNFEQVRLMMHYAAEKIHSKKAFDSYTTSCVDW